MLAALVAGYGEVRADGREALELYGLYHALELWDWLAFIGARDRLPPITSELRRACEPSQLL